MFKRESNKDFTNPVKSSNATSETGNAKTNGVDKGLGEGGFWAKILFQDQEYPFRYAFSQVHAMPDGTTHPPQMKFLTSFASKTSTGDDVATPPGELSVFNIGDEASGKPFDTFQAMDLNASETSSGSVALKDYSIKPGQVILYATECNENLNVPPNTIVWMRSGEDFFNIYDDSSLGFPSKNYFFEYNQFIYARILGLNKTSESDTHGNGDYSWQEVYRERALIGNPDKLQWSYTGRTGYLGPLGRHSIPEYEGSFSDSNFINPAREINGNPKVLLNSIVKLYPSAVIEYNKDGSIYSQEYLFCYEKEIKYAIAIADWSVAGGQPYAVSCRSCDNMAGDGVDNTETPFNVYFIPTDNGQDPAIFTGDVITYDLEGPLGIEVVTSPGSFDNKLGTVLMYSTINGQTPGLGWHLCDGSNPAGNKLGGALPDMRGLFPRCLDPAGTHWLTSPGAAVIPEGIDGDNRGVSSTREMKGTAVGGTALVVTALEDAESWSGVAVGPGNDAAVKPPSYVIGFYIRYK